MFVRVRRMETEPGRGISDSDDSDVSSLDEDDLDEELNLQTQMSHINEERPTGISLDDLKRKTGRQRVRIQREYDKSKNEIADTLSKVLPHKNERPRKTRYANRQRILVFASRGINQRMRHLMTDIKNLLPHSKSEPKFEDKRNLAVINEICQEHNCNSCIFFESRRHTDLYMWISRVPNGPAIKFLVTNVHTLGELRMTGNCLKGSRPLLVFDQNFDKSIERRLMKELLFQTFGSPRGHPKTAPFVDHVFSFFWADKKIWFRNYQIVRDALENQNQTSSAKPVLVEIGPRFVLHPVRIQRGSFQGTTIYQSRDFVNPNAERRALKQRSRVASKMKRSAKMNKYLSKQLNKFARKQRREDLELESDPEQTNDVFETGLDFVRDEGDEDGDVNMEEDGLGGDDDDIDGFLDE